MVMGVRTRFMVSAVGVVAILLLLLAVAPERAAAQSKELVVVEAADLTGPFAPSGRPKTDGARAYVRYVNEKLGGINGVKVKHIVVDTSYVVDREVAAYKRARDVENALFFFSINSSGIATIAPLAAEDGVPFGGHNAEPIATFKPGTWFFPAIPLWLEGGAAAFDWYLKNEWSKKHQGFPKVGMVLMDAHPGKTASRLYQAQFKARGIPIVLEIFVPLVAPDMKGVVLQLRQTKADIVISHNTDVNWTTLTKEMMRQGVDIPKLAPYFGPIGQDVVKAMGDAGVGLMSFLPYAVWDDADVPGIQKIRGLYKEWYGPDRVEDRHHFYWGWVGMCQVVESMKRAMAKVGYDGLTKDIKAGRKALKTAMENDMSGFTCDGITPPLKWSATDHRPFDAVRVARIEPGPVLKAVSGWSPIPPLTDEQRTVEFWAGK
jgi:branched-chain amino acid transport system substrate-binding protein